MSKFRLVLFALTVCVFVCSGMGAEPLPVLTPVAREALEQAWEVLPHADPAVVKRGKVSEYRLVQDEILGREVLETEQGWTFVARQPLAGEYVIEALVRFPVKTTGKTAARGRPGLQISCGERTADDVRPPAYTFGMRTFANLFSGQAGPGENLRPKDPKAPKAPKAPAKPDAKAAKDTVKEDWGGTFALKSGLNPGDISPLLPEAVRRERESSLANMPADADERWHRLRAEVGAGRVRVFVNGALVCDAAPLAGAVTSGSLQVALNGLARLAELTVRPLPPLPAGFATVPLDYRANRKTEVDLAGLGGDAGGRVLLGTVPFDLSRNLDGRNQVNIGASLYRHRLGTSYTADYDCRVTVPGPDEFDPDRLTVRVPFRAWRRAWILAAASGAANHAPLVTLRFYRPATGWSIDAATTVPEFSFTGNVAGATPVPAKGADGKPLNLWLIPVDLDTGALASDYKMTAIEITKQVLPNVGYPDPNNYAYFHGGLPSSVQLFGLTLEAAPLHAAGRSSNNGNTFEAPARPDWLVTVRNQTANEQRAKVQVTATDPYGKVWSETKETTLAAAGETKLEFKPESGVFGLYAVETRVECGDWSQRRKGTFLYLPKNERQEKPESSPWGLWCWFGTHDTNPDVDDNARLLKAVGAINTTLFGRRERVDGVMVQNNDYYGWRQKWGLGAPHYRAIPRNPPDWTKKNPVDQEAFAKYAEEVGKTVGELKAKNPDLIYANSFAENSVSLRLTHGVPSWAFGDPWFEYTAAEKDRLHSLWTAAKAGAVGIAAHAPGVKYIFGHCAPNFFTPFFMQEDWDQYKDRIAGFGLDMPQFERMPERPPRATEPTLLYFLQKEMRERGLQDKALVHFESYFPSSHELALGWQGQAESTVRTAVLSLALGTTKFKDCWTLHDCGARWGSQHYGCGGLISRPPEYNPKPAAAAFATMTRVLDLCRYDAWLPTGSKTAFCLRFKGPDRLVYPVWTVRGSRDLELVPDGDSVKLVRVDAHGNEFPLPVENGRAVVRLGQAVEWVVARGGGLREVRVGAPAYAEAPGSHRVTLEDFAKNEWLQSPAGDEVFQNNHWDVVRRHAPMKVSHVQDAERGARILEVTLENPDQKQPLTGFYTVLTPPQPIPIPGKARALGFYGRGASAWHRVIFEVEDAAGERWFNCGFKDVFNADDIHSRTYLNHDGWRYMETPLPANAPGDDYRESSTVSWGYANGDGIVNLPLKLTRVYIVMRPQMIYVNELLPVDSMTVGLGEIMALYPDAEAMTDKPVLVQKAAAGMLVASHVKAKLPNPIADLAEKGAGEPAVIEKLYPPETMQAGDRIFVQVKPVDGAAGYKVYVSAYPDGSGAQPMGKPEPNKPNVIYIRGLQPAISMYFFATWVGADKKESKPSAVRETVLKDEFPFK